VVDEPRRRRAGRDDGQAVMLLPAAILILVVLGALAVDLSLVYLANRQLHDAAAAAANDAAAQCFDEVAYRTTGRFTVDAARVDRVARATLAAQDGDVVRRATATITATATADPARPCQVTVRLRSESDELFLKAVPGQGPTAVEAVESATLVVG
jgi:uncharacterized membrane protein